MVTASNRAYENLAPLLPPVRTNLNRGRSWSHLVSATITTDADNALPRRLPTNREEDDEADNSFDDDGDDDHTVNDDDVWQEDFPAHAPPDVSDDTATTENDTLVPVRLKLSDFFPQSDHE